MNHKTTKAIFLDRDGVIIKTKIKNGRPYAINSILDIELIDGVFDGLNLLKSHDFLLFIVTNQPDVAIGIQTRESVESVHQWLMDKLPIDEIAVCYTRSEKYSESCYKPSPKMLIDLADKFNTDLSKSYLIGDRWRDIGAGNNAGCKTIFIDYFYEELNPFTPDWTVSNFAKAIEILKIEVKKNEGVL